jgi:amidohydrolase
MFDTSKIIASVEAMKGDIIANRRYLHEHPEISGQEVETSKFAQEKMKELGLTPVMCGNIAFYCIIDSGKPGKTLALRADMDALAMPESETNLKQKKVALSKNPAACHACGHDGHVSMLIAAATYIAQHKDELTGRVMVVFESGEESQPSSWPFIVEALKKEKADAIWGIHLYAMTKAGTISVDAGPRMSGAGAFIFTIHGRGGHGSRPDQSINPVLAASEIVSKLQTVIPLNVAPDQAGVVTVAAMKGGEAWNIIPDTCTVSGGIRYFSLENYTKITDNMKNIIECLAAANHCTATYEQWPGKAFPVINNEELAAIAAAACDKVVPGARAKEPAWMASESFGAYSDLIPGLFAFVGIADEALGSGAPHHNVKFDLNEDALVLGAKATLQFVSDYLA